jgi:anti-sigma B factor antagonist
MSLTSSASNRSESIRRRLDRQYLVVVPPDELDELTAPDFADRLAAVEENTDIVVDLRGVTFCGSKGLSVLLNAAREAAERDCTLTLSYPTRQFDRLLAACALEDHFTVRRPTPRRNRRAGGADPSRR